MVHITGSTLLDVVLIIFMFVFIISSMGMFILILRSQSHFEDYIPVYTSLTLLLIMNALVMCEFLCVILLPQAYVGAAWLTTPMYFAQISVYLLGVYIAVDRFIRYAMRRAYESVFETLFRHIPVSITVAVFVFTLIITIGNGCDVVNEWPSRVDIECRSGPNVVPFRNYIVLGCGSVIVAVYVLLGVSWLCGLTKSEGWTPKAVRERRILIVSTVVCAFCVVECFCFCLSLYFPGNRILFYFRAALPNLRSLAHAAAMLVLHRKSTETVFTQVIYVISQHPSAKVDHRGDIQSAWN